jgi:transcriptional regulator with XRE-family HTH domain
VATALLGLRSTRDLTQTELGALVGMPQSSVARLESGRQNPSVGMLRRIAGAVGMELVLGFKPRARPRETEPRRIVRTPEAPTPKPSPLAEARSRSRRRRDEWRVW